MTRLTRLEYAERWMRDGIGVVDSAGFFLTVEVDMSQAKRLIDKNRAAGIRLTYTHVMVRSTALVLTKHPQMRQIVGDRTRLQADQVDIGLSVSGPTFVAPVYVIKDAAKKTLADIVSEVDRGATLARERQAKMLDDIGRWGWLVPSRLVRRAILRRMMGSLAFRREGAGTFQVSCLPEVDLFVPLLFSTTAILGVGGVRERVLAMQGSAEVRPAAHVSCAVDHKVCDGATAAAFLHDLRVFLEDEGLRERL